MYKQSAKEFNALMAKSGSRARIIQDDKYEYVPTFNIVILDPMIDMRSIPMLADRFYAELEKWFSPAVLYYNSTKTTFWL